MLTYKEVVARFREKNSKQPEATWTYQPRLASFEQGGRVGYKPGGIVEPGVMYYGKYEDPNYKKKWYQKNKGSIADKYQENKESISKKRKEEYANLTDEERLAKSRKEQQPPEKRAKTYKKRVLAKTPLTEGNLKVLDRFKLNLTYAKNMNEIIQEHGGTRPSKEAISDLMEIRFETDPEFQNRWNKVHGNKPFKSMGLAPSHLRNTYNRSMAATRNVTGDNFKQALTELFEKELAGTGTSLDEFIKNDFKFTDTFMADQTDSPEARYQRRYKQIMRGKTGWTPDGKGRTAWFANPDQKGATAVTNLNKKLKIDGKGPLGFVRSHYFGSIQAQKLYDLGLLNEDAAKNFKERYTYKPRYINDLQSMTYDKDVYRALRNFNNHNDRSKLATEINEAAAKAKRLGLDVDELFYNSNTEKFNFLDKKRVLQTGGDRETRYLVKTAMNEIANVQSMTDKDLGEDMIKNINQDYGKKADKIIKKVKKGSTQFYPETPKWAQRISKPTSFQKLIQRTGAGIDPILAGRAVVEETGSLLKKPMSKTLSVLKNIFETKSPAGGAFWAAEAPLLILQGAYGRYASERDFRKALKETGQFDDKNINMLGETYGQELSDLGNVGLESYAVDQTDTSQFREDLKKSGVSMEDLVKMGDEEVGIVRDKQAAAKEIEKQRIEDAYKKETGRRTVEFNKGGRVSFKLGSMGRRGFLKLLAALGIGGATVGTGLIKLGGKAVGKKAAVKTGVDIATSTPGMPSWFPALVNKIIKEGDDVTAKLATTDRQVVHTKKIPGGDEATVYRDLDTGNVTVEYGGPLMNKKGQIIRASNDPDVIHLEYRAPEVIEEGAMKGKKTKSEFSAAEAEPEVVNWDGDIEMSGVNEVNKVEDLVTPTNKLQEFATGKNLNIRDRLKLERQQKYKNKLETDTMTQIDYVEGKRGPLPDPGDYGGGKDMEIDVFAKYRGEKASGGLASYDDYLPGIDDID